MYKYLASINRIIDGDTVELIIDLGFKIKVKHTCRLYGINTPEIRGPERPEGLKAKNHLKELIGEGSILCKTYKTGKYGRWLVELFKDGKNINKQMIEDGYADPCT